MSYVQKRHRCCLKSKDTKKLNVEISKKFGIEIQEFFEPKIRVESYEVDAVTVPPYVMDKMFYHPLTEVGIKQFKIDLKGDK